MNSSNHARRVRARAIALSDPRPALARQALLWLAAGLFCLALLIGAGAARAAAPDSFADLAEKLLPAVVNISTTQTVKPERGPDMPQFPPGSPFEEFFKDFFDKQGRSNGGPPRRATSLGSGFIIDSSGLVVTNNHVIADADEINVILHDESAFKAEVVGRDAKTDLALLRIKANKKLSAVSFGDSDGVRVGDWVLAIGNPFGLGGTVTAGIISARARDIHAGPYDDFLQTDASINRGNSGGPMFNLKGDVIGVNTAIISPSGGSIGIGFAIPATMAKAVIGDLQKYGKTRRGWLGVHIQSMTDEIAETLGLKEAKGALVASVAENGPAAKSGIRAGDVILTFDGKEVGEMRRLPRMVAETSLNKDVEVTVWRDRKRQTIRARIGELQEDETPELAKAESGKPANPAIPGQLQIPSVGFSVAAVNPQLRDRFNLGPDAKGLVITDVADNGPAAEKNIKAGDQLLEVSLEPVKTAQEVLGKVDAVKKDGRKLLLLTIVSNGTPRIVAVRVDSGQSRK